MKKGNKILSFKKRSYSCNILDFTLVSIFYKRVGGLVGLKKYDLTYDIINELITRL